MEGSCVDELGAVVCEEAELSVVDPTRQVYEAAIPLYNEGGLAGFAQAHDERAVLTTPAGTFRGRVAIREYWTRQHDAFPTCTSRST